MLEDCSFPEGKVGEQHSHVRDVHPIPQEGGKQYSHVRGVHPLSRLSPLHPPHTRSGYECAERRHSNAERESPLLNIWGRAYFVQFLNIGDVFDLFNF